MKYIGNDQLKELKSKKKYRKHKFMRFIVVLLILATVALCVVTIKQSADKNSTNTAERIQTITDIPNFAGSSYIELNGNIPLFTDEEKSMLDAFETYSELDELGRCGEAFANVCIELMPDEPRGEIGMIKPSGWHTIRYDDLIEDRYLYNRCHLIAYALSGENANERNLITGTRYMNVSGMLPFEIKVANYVRDTGHHVLYRVTPIFKEDELVARGVSMEAWSVEDHGAGVCFYVFCYNIQPGIIIDYKTGESCEQ